VADFNQTAAGAKAQADNAPSLTFGTVVDMFFPRNLAKAVVDFQMLPLIAFALLLGAAGTQLADADRAGLQRALQVICDLMTRIVHYALLLGPVAVAA